jgi:hypothetical protein
VPPAGSDEARNLEGAGTFVARDFSSVPGEEFDDLVQWVAIISSSTAGARGAFALISASRTHGKPARGTEAQRPQRNGNIRTYSVGVESWLSA